MKAEASGRTLKDAEEWSTEMSNHVKSNAHNAASQAEVKKKEAAPVSKPAFGVDDISLNMTSSQIMALCKGQGKRELHFFHVVELW